MEKKCSINVRLLPIKAHYFFYYGAVGGVIPFMPVMAKGLGIHATAVGIIFAIVPFSIFVFTPILGYITDYLKNIRAVIFVLVAVTAVTYLSTIFIPAIDSRADVAVVKCKDHDGLELVYSNTESDSIKCLEKVMGRESACELSYRLCGSVIPVNLFGLSSIWHPGKDGLGNVSSTKESFSLHKESSSIYHPVEAIVSYKSLGNMTLKYEDPSVYNPGEVSIKNHSSEKIYVKEEKSPSYHTVEVTSSNNSTRLVEDSSAIVLIFKPDSTRFTCDSCIAANSSQLSCVGHHVLNSCMTTKSTVYFTFQFWIFTLFVVVAGTTSSAVFSLSDAACCEVLGDQLHYYGRQRLWGTLGWGSVTQLAGLLNDVATTTETSNFNPGFYVMVCLVVVDLVLLSKIKVTKTNFSLSICKDIGKTLSSWQSVVFVTAVYVFGALNGLTLNYRFWYLQDMGASQGLMGLMVAVQSIGAEVPFFFFAGWFIKKLGYFYCLTSVFFAFTLRFSLYCALQDPWLLLPAEVLHGVTYALFYSAMTGYAKGCAAPGTEATMIGIFGGLAEGLGAVTGSLLGGLGIDRLGSRTTFLVAAVVSLVSWPVFALVHELVKRRSSSPPQAAPDGKLGAQVHSTSSGPNLSYVLE